ncbi:hypothetical protein [Nesterenkonia jeotgali]|uniref:Uncharacterized protein n=1 Tax=Nesterenkonia jeotgali TaxID=317018 RepID=A0A839FEA5_9MICC|nr:hypothetical protein [Nesterenkonia jeotgali]MBA8920070.1 hypothetical protein [Nesterenkonia jeotgali]
MTKHQIPTGDQILTTARNVTSAVRLYATGHQSEAIGLMDSEDNHPLVVSEYFLSWVTSLLDDGKLPPETALDQMSAELEATRLELQQEAEARE